MIDGLLGIWGFLPRFVKTMVSWPFNSLIAYLRLYPQMAQNSSRMIFFSLLEEFVRFTDRRRTFRTSEESDEEGNKAYRQGASSYGSHH